MANEVRATGMLEYFPENGKKIQFGDSVSFDITGPVHADFEQEIGTSEEALLLGDISTPANIIILNLDTTNYVEMRPASGTADLIKISAGKFAGPFELAASAPYMIADTAAVKVRVLVIGT